MIKKEIVCAKKNLKHLKKIKRFTFLWKNEKNIRKVTTLCYN